MPSKTAHRTKLVEYLADPSNPILSRAELATQVLGFKYPQQIHIAFTAAELNEIEREALAIRRGKYASALARVDAGLLKKAAEGDPAAAKLVYQRFEGWSEKTNLNIGGGISIGAPLTLEEELFLQKHYTTTNLLEEGK